MACDLRVPVTDLVRMAERIQQPVWEAGKVIVNAAESQRDRAFARITGYARYLEYSAQATHSAVRLFDIYFGCYQDGPTVAPMDWTEVWPIADACLYLASAFHDEAGCYALPSAPKDVVAERVRAQFKVLSRFGYVVNGATPFEFAYVLRDVALGALRVTWAKISTDAVRRTWALLRNPAHALRHSPLVAAVACYVVSMSENDEKRWARDGPVRAWIRSVRAAMGAVGARLNGSNAAYLTSRSVAEAVADF